MNKHFLSIPAGNVMLPAELVLPDHAEALVIFSHGSGSSRLSPRNGFIASMLNRHGIATLLFDLLTEEEDLVYENRFNISLLSVRLVLVTVYMSGFELTHDLSFGYFGASTGAASALAAAAALPDLVHAVVSRGGRPDMVQEVYKKVKAPVLLIVGSLDEEVLALNRMALKGLEGEKRLEIVKGATHLFEEPGTLEEVGRLALSWYSKYLMQKEVHFP